ncbi:hypothetical protein MMC13_006834 [Lambiella insularis]|nr:hypothetical protein [Lambiella insularis]
MDPLSLAASITALLQLTSTVVSFLNAVKAASKDRARIAIETSNMYALLTVLKYRVEEARLEDPWYTTIRTLAVENGALDQYHSALKLLASKLDTRSGTKLGRALMWKFDKVEVAEILSKIERLKSLINLALTNDLFTLSKSIKEDVATMRARLERTQLSNDHGQRQAIVNWLTPLDFKSRHREIISRRQEGTGQWLLNSSEFQAWLNEPGEVLYCPGMPGAGKTVIASIVIDHLQTKFSAPDARIACIFCNYKDKIRQTAQELLASLLKQLLQDSHTLSDSMTSLYEDHVKRSERLAPEDLIKELQSEIGRSPRVFIVVDALDECTEEGNARMSLLNELRSLSGNVNLLVTSRNFSSIESAFNDTKSLEIYAAEADVTQYIMGRLQREQRLAKHIKSDPGLQSTIVSKILAQAKGMFLLAQLHMDSLVNKNNRKAIYSALNNLPKGISDTYDEAMERIRAQNQDDKELGENVLLWISFAFRPLSIIELQHALAVDDTTTDTDLDALPDEEIIISVCAGLVVVDNESSTVRLIHYTTQEYFDRTRNAQFPGAHKIILNTCLRYFSFPDFASGPCKTRAEYARRTRRHALLRYVAKHWGYHAWTDLDDSAKGALLLFLRNEQKLRCFSQALFQHKSQTIHAYGIDMTGMHLVAYFGCYDLAMHLLQNGVAADSLGSMDRTPLHLAVEEGHYRVIEMLVCQAQVSCDAQDKVGLRPLHLAASTGQEVTVQLLLDHNASLDARTRRLQTPLHLAAEEGHLGVLKLLVDAGSEVNALSDTETTPLYRASRRGQVHIIKALIAEGADVNIPTWDGYTALRSAVGYNQAGAVEVLLSAMPDLDFRDPKGLTALEVAQINGSNRIVRLLKEAAASQAALYERGVKSA